MKMVMMKIDAEASKIQAAVVVFPLQIPFRGEVPWYCGGSVSLVFFFKNTP
jgi:hypothetical protein